MKKVKTHAETQVGAPGDYEVDESLPGDLQGSDAQKATTGLESSRGRDESKPQAGAHAVGMSSQTDHPPGTDNHPSPKPKDLRHSDDKTKAATTHGKGNK